MLQSDVALLISNLDPSQWGLSLPVDESSQTSMSLRHSLILFRTDGKNAAEAVRPPLAGCEF